MVRTHQPGQLAARAQGQMTYKKRENVQPLWRSGVLHLCRTCPRVQNVVRGF